MPTPYDPSNAIDRYLLAQEIEQVLTKAGFVEEWHGDEQGKGRDPGDWTKERTFYRFVEDTPDIRIVVYTTIEGTRVRASGKDAIRVAAVYRTKAGRDQGLKKDIRVNRTGDIEGIVERMLERARGAWAAAKNALRCPSCGAPMFVSKAGKDTCAEICWKAR
jgi:hypothetical protein